MNIEFEGKTVIITGAARGFGRAIALAFAQRKATVWACDILSDELKETRKLCEDFPGRCETRAADITDRPIVIDFIVEREANVWPIVPPGAGIGEMILEGGVKA